MRKGWWALALALALVVAGCSDEQGDADGSTARDEAAAGKTAEIAEATVEDALGHQAFQPSTRLVVPSAEGDALDRAARVLAGLSEGPAGTPPRVVDELGRAFVAASSSRAFGKVLLGTGRKPRQLGPGNFADYVEKQSRSVSRAAPETAEGEWKLFNG